MTGIQRAEFVPHVLVLSPDQAGWREALVGEKDLSLFGGEVARDVLSLMEMVEIKCVAWFEQREEGRS